MSRHIAAEVSTRIDWSACGSIGNVMPPRDPDEEDDEEDEESVALVFVRLLHDGRFIGAVVIRFGAAALQLRPSRFGAIGKS